MAAALLLSIAAAASAQVPDKKALTLDGAKKVIAAAFRGREKIERPRRRNCSCR
jgi:hypothetical protein